MNPKLKKQATPKEIARNVLTDATSRAPTESLEDLNSALTEIDEVERSPLFLLNQSLKNSK